MLSHRLPILASLVALAAAGFACSASDSGKSGTPAPAASAAAVPFDVGGKDCGLVTSYMGARFAGDSVCITAPSPDAGMQFHYGPVNYNDPVEVGKYVLKPGEEVTDCTFFTTKNTESVYFNAYHSRMRPGSHHMLLYIQPSGSGAGPVIGNNGLSFGSSGPPMDTGTSGPAACNQGLATRNLFGAQTPTLDVSQIGGGPENDGLAVEIPPKQQGVMQAHFINATSGPLLREVWANIIYTPKDKVTQLGEPIFFLGGLRMNVPYGQTQAITGVATVPTNAAPDFRLVIGTGHYHSHTTEFKAWKTVNGVREPLIHDYNTLGHAPDPTTWYFTSGTQNPTPDPATQASGAFTGVAHMQAGDTIDWECDVTNNDIQGGVKFANAVYTGEMCNMFGLYAPSTGSPWQAVNF